MCMCVCVWGGGILVIFHISAAKSHSVFMFMLNKSKLMALDICVIRVCKYFAS